MKKGTKKAGLTYNGVYTAIITPFKLEPPRLKPTLDLEKLSVQVELQVKGGVDGIVPVGTTGESATLNFEEHLLVIRQAVIFAAGRIAVLAGTGGNSNEEAIQLTRAAEKAGADGSLQVAPYYNKPTQEGLFQHFRAVAKATGLPIILYSIPSRCGVEIAVDTVCRLKDACKNIEGIKEAGGDPKRVTKLRQKLGEDFSIFCGDDDLTLPFMSLGAVGVVSVLSNLLPRRVADMVDYAIRGGYHEARAIFEIDLAPIIPLLFVDGNPSGIKKAMELAGLDSGELRLPLVPVSQKTCTALRRVITKLNLIGKAHS